MKKFVQKALTYSVYSLLALTLCFLSISNTHAAARKPAAPPSASAVLDTDEEIRETSAMVRAYCANVLKSPENLAKFLRDNPVAAGPMPACFTTFSGSRPSASAVRAPAGTAFQAFSSAFEPMIQQSAGELASVKIAPEDLKDLAQRPFNTPEELFAATCEKVDDYKKKQAHANTRETTGKPKTESTGLARPEDPKTVLKPKKEEPKPKTEHKKPVTEVKTPLVIDPLDCLFEELAQLVDKSRTHADPLVQIIPYQREQKLSEILACAYIKLLNVENKAAQKFASDVLSAKPYENLIINPITLKTITVLSPLRYPDKSPEERIRLTQEELIADYLLGLETSNDYLSLLNCIIKELFLIKQTDPNLFKHITPEAITSGYLKHSKEFVYDEQLIEKWARREPEALGKNISTTMTMIQNARRKRLMDKLAQDAKTAQPKAEPKPKTEPKKEEPKKPASAPVPVTEAPKPAKKAPENPKHTVLSAGKNFVWYIQSQFKDLYDLIVECSQQADPVDRLMTHDKKKFYDNTIIAAYIKLVIQSRNIKNKELEEYASKILTNQPFELKATGFLQVPKPYRTLSSEEAIPKIQHDIINNYFKVFDHAPFGQVAKDNFLIFIKIIHQLFSIKNSDPKLFVHITQEAIAKAYFTYNTNFLYDEAILTTCLGGIPVDQVRKDIEATVTFIQMRRKETKEPARPNTAPAKPEPTSEAPKTGPKKEEPKKVKQTGPEPKKANKKKGKPKKENPELDGIDELEKDLKKLSVDDGKAYTLDPKSLVFQDLAEFFSKHPNLPKLFCTAKEITANPNLVVISYMKLFNVQDKDFKTYASSTPNGLDFDYDVQAKLIDYYCAVFKKAHVENEKQDLYPTFLKIITELFLMKAKDPKFFEHITPDKVVFGFFNNERQFFHDHKFLKKWVLKTPKRVGENLVATVKEILRIFDLRNGIVFETQEEKEMRELSKQQWDRDKMLLDPKILAQEYEEKELKAQSETRLEKLKARMCDDTKAQTEDRPAELQEEEEKEVFDPALDDEKIAFVKNRLIFSALANNLYNHKDNPEQLYHYLSSRTCKEYPVLLVIMYMYILRVNPDQKVRTKITKYYNKQKTEGETVFIYQDMVASAEDDHDDFVYNVLVYTECLQTNKPLEFAETMLPARCVIDLVNYYLDFYTKYYVGPEHTEAQEFERYYKNYLQDCARDKKMYERYTEEERARLSEERRQQMTDKPLTKRDVKPYFDDINKKYPRVQLLDIVAEMGLLKEQGLTRLCGEFIVDQIKTNKKIGNPKELCNRASRKYRHNAFVQEFLTALEV